MDMKPTSFRIGALVLGMVGAIATTVLSSLSGAALLCGVTFGAGGWLVDYLTRFRKLGGQFSAWAMVAGAVIVLFSMRTAIAEGELGLMEYYTIPLQYVSTVLICWGLLLIIVPKFREP